MLLQELKSMFLTRYELECRKAKQTALILNDSEIAFFLSDAQQDIQRRLKILKGYTDISLVANTDSYALPTNFGQSILGMIDGNPINKSNRVLESSNLIGGPSEYQVMQGSPSHIVVNPAPNKAYTLRLYYYLDTLYYRPSLSSAQSWGTFNGIIYTGSALLPEKYSMAIIYKMLSMMIDSFEVKYETELNRLRGGLVEDVEDTMRYNFGGIDEPSFSHAITGVNTQTTIIPSTSDEPTKQIRFIASETGDPVVQFSNGWSAEPVITNLGTTITVTDLELTNFMDVKCNNEGINYTYDPSTYTLTFDTGTGWGDLQIIIRVW